MLMVLLEALMDISAKFELHCVYIYSNFYHVKRDKEFKALIHRLDEMQKIATFNIRCFSAQPRCVLVILLKTVFTETHSVR
jgi:hypothetical protein